MSPAPLRAMQPHFPDVSMGSYPCFEEGVGFTTTLVLRGARRGAARRRPSEAVGRCSTALRGNLAG